MLTYITHNLLNNEVKTYSGEVLTSPEFKVQPHILDMRSPCPRNLGAKSANVLWQSDETRSFSAASSPTCKGGRLARTCFDEK